MTSEERKSKSLQKAEWVEALKHRKKAVSPLFALPGISKASMKPDWMHVADEGCCALAAGQVLSERLSKYKGSTKEKRAQTLWTELKALYEKLKIPACRHRQAWQGSRLGCQGCRNQGFLHSCAGTISQKQEIASGQLARKGCVQCGKTLCQHVQCFGSRIRWQPDGGKW